MKFLLVIRHGLYLRNYEPVVRGLAEAKHHVVIAITDNKPVDDTLLRRLPAEYPQVSVVPVPEREGWWWTANEPLRIMQDYLRYFDPAYGSTPGLFARAARNVPSPIRMLMEQGRLGRVRPVRRFLSWCLDLVERCTLADRALVAWVGENRPDALLVTPLIDFNYYQLDALKAGKSLGVPTALLVASWDNLTNKGTIQSMPDLVVVWNDLQRQEAERMHGVPANRIVVTGAQLFDQWFAMQPRTTREEFCARVGGMDPGRPVILYLCSSTFICAHEVAFVKRWLRGLRNHPDPALRSAGVLVRPHPVHGAQWAGVELSEFRDAVVWPPAGAAPLDADRKHAYYDSLYHAAAVVGINTTGFLEAGIVGRPTLTLRAEEFPNSQDATLHFRYLTAGGLLHASDDLPSHLNKLAGVLQGGREVEARVRQFIKDFLRPHGLAKPATPIFVEMLERFARQGARKPVAAPAVAPVVRTAIAPVATVLRRMYLARLSRRPSRSAAVARKADGRGSAARSTQ